MSFSLGVDPGTYGAAVVLDSDKVLVERLSFKSAGLNWAFELRELIEKWRPFGLEVWIEHIHALAKVGTTSTFEFGRRFGMVLGICHGLGIRYELMTSGVWQKLSWAEGPAEAPWIVKYAKDPKGRSLATARLYWKEKFDDYFLGPKGGVDDGLIDAALIAWAGSVKASNRIGIGVEDGQMDMVASIKYEKGQKRAKKSRAQRVSFERKLSAQRAKQ